MRQEHVGARKRMQTNAPAKAELDQTIVAHTRACMAHFGALGRSIAAYNPLPSEPGPGDFAAQLAADAATVWLPISLANGVLAWAKYDGSIGAGALGITEPTGARFNSNVLRSCGLIIAPALAVDQQYMRLGKGAGYYDRALTGLDVPVAAVVFDDEFVQHVPHDSHDVAVDAVITPSGFFVR
ncbi:5-formyltetrahydrofolate cyclo-ligase [Corynebacterium riegelii]|nr:5-formyltetrahydrofolate cyclo-ligase [Corynebacterium riegelii]